MLSKKLLQHSKLIYQRSVKKKCEIGGAIHQDRIIRTTKGTRGSVVIPYNKKYDTYFHTHLTGSFFGEDICPYHTVSMPSMRDLIYHMDPSRSHIIEYIFTEFGYYKLTTPGGGITDELTLCALRLYYTIVIGVFQLQDNGDDIYGYVKSFLYYINTIDLDVLPPANTAQGKAVRLFVMTDTELKWEYKYNYLMKVLIDMGPRQFVKVEFFCWN